MPLTIDSSVIDALRCNDLMEPIVALFERYRRAVDQLSNVDAHVLKSHISNLAQYVREGQVGGSLVGDLWCDQLEAQVDFVRSQLLSLLHVRDQSSRKLSARMKSWQVRWSDLTFLTDDSRQRLLLGEGGFGKVFAATYKGVPVAVKQFVRAGVESCLEDFKREVGALSRLRHPAIVQFYGATLRNPADPSDPSEYAIVMERGAMTLLEAMNVMRDPEALASCPVPLPHTIDEKLKLLQSLAEALMYLHHHDPPIVLQDIKPANVILTADGKAKFIDFGLATVRATTLNTRSRITAGDGDAARIGHTPQYAAPEVLKGLVRHPQVEQDIYSFGVLLYELLIGHTRVVDSTRGDLLRPLSLPAECGVVPRIFDLVVGCTAPEERRRPSAQQVYACLVMGQPVYIMTDREIPLKDVNSHFWLSIDASSTRLFAACLRGDDFTVRQIALGSGVTSSLINARNSVGATALHAACQTGSYEIVSLLISKGADVNCAADDGTTPLIVACLNRRVKVAHRLLEAGADVNNADNSGITPLCAAVQTGSAVITRTLIEAGAAIDAKKLMHIACANNNVDCVELLIKRNVDVNEAVDDNCTTPLMAGASLGFTAVMTLLIRRGAHTDARDINGHSALQVAVINEQLDSIALLLSNGANVCAADNEGREPLHLAAAIGDARIVRALLLAGANVDAYEKSGQTPLHHAAENAHRAVITALLQFNARIEAADHSRRTSLHRAAECGHVPVVAALLAAYASVNVVDKDGKSPLRHAVDKGHDSVVMKLLQAHADVNCADRAGQTPLHSASQNGYTSIVAALIEAEADVDVVDNDGKTPLYYAVENRHEAVVASLLKAHADVNAADSCGYTPLHRAALHGTESVVTALVKNNANVDAVDKCGVAALHNATAKGDASVVTTLLEARANVDVPDLFGQTPLHRAAKFGHDAIITILLQSLAVVDAIDNDGKTPLHRAAKNGRTQAVSLLLKAGAHVDAPDDDGRRPLHLAVLFNHAPVVEVLLNCNATVDAVTKETTTPLLIAAEKGHAAVVVTLLMHKADVNLTDRNGDSPLHRAAANGHAAVVKTLLHWDASKLSRNSDGKSPLDVANNVNIAQLLSP